MWAWPEVGCVALVGVGVGVARGGLHSPSGRGGAGPEVGWVETSAR